MQYTQVTLQSTYIASVAVTFAITLDDASAQNPEPLTQFVNFFTNDLQTLAGFVVQNGSRGTLGVIPTGNYNCITVQVNYHRNYIHVESLCTTLPTQKGERESTTVAYRKPLWATACVRIPMF